MMKTLLSLTANTEFLRFRCSRTKDVRCAPVLERNCFRLGLSSFKLGVLKVLVLSVMLSGCEAITKPVPWGMELKPEGSPTYQVGWTDGCETGLSVYGNDRYKMVYQWKQDPKMLLNDEYYKAWKDAYTYCRWYALNWVRSARK